MLYLEKQINVLLHVKGKEITFHAYDLSLVFDLSKEGHFFGVQSATKSDN